MSQTKTLHMRKSAQAAVYREEPNGLDRFAVAFIALSPSQRLIVTALAVVALVAVVAGFAVTSVAVPMPFFAILAGLLLGLPSIVLSRVKRPDQRD